MPFKPLLALAAFALLCGAPAARAQQQQQQDQAVIDDFVTSRGVSFDDPGKKTTQPQRQTTHTGPATHRSNSGARNPGAGGVASGSKGSSSTKASQTNTASNKTSTDKGATENARENAADKGGVQTVKASSTTGSLQPVGLGYTVFMKDKSGGLLAVDTSQEYKSGDRIAISLEPNIEGYIYIFNAENDRDPEMLFPNVVLDKGANAAHAHVRETYPADLDYAFEFDQTPANEHVYVIVSRRPLDGVPTGDALAQFCGKSRDDCYWKPTPEQWARIKSGAAGGRVTEAKNTQLAQLQKQPVQPSTLQRGIKIKRDDPAPAVVRVNASPDSDTLVTVIKLVHK
ncbi:MAG: hypothetical protein DMF67_11680 [Acidobacteria bacterium]|nr:MAG: hypothetical protein DMF67_11680 [Acidobacteriota bacterium]